MSWLSSIRVRRTPLVGALVCLPILAGAGVAWAAERDAPTPPEPATERITLEQAVARALDRNPTVTVAVAEI